MNRWLARVMDAGPSHSGIRFFGARFLQRCAELLPQVQVGFCECHGELIHPARTAVALAASRIGSVAESWYDAATMSVMAVLQIDSRQHHRGLVRHELERRLPGIGISVLFTGDPLTRNHGPAAFAYVDVGGILSCDLVSRPDGIGCHLLRSIKEESCSS